ncbi:peptide ABC transporter substrate-binding protein [Paludisphaera rhizosphaerae]|uniref:peptide ABC transporter substrate-binding protein n=1 Tax=Paludisphaera rhizosphaerae TaxID=2711216 RepID=UPI0013EDFB92|nr:peptide ABC transporter substrate-binding protein [Paludisphaera rhizosphaerae]
MDDCLSEAEWKYLSQHLQPLALDRFCRRVLAEVAQVATDDAKGSHERYRAVFQLIEERDRELAAAFDGLRRSTAFWQLIRMRSLGLITDEELAGFSPETQDAIRALMTSRNR